MISLFRLLHFQDLLFDYYSLLLIDVRPGIDILLLLFLGSQGPVLAHLYSIPLFRLFSSLYRLSGYYLYRPILVELVRDQMGLGCPYQSPIILKVLDL